MDIREILKLIKPKKLLVIAFIVVFGGLGAAANYYFPHTYYATGSIFVKRTIYPYSNDHFTYEGYYGQQAALAYTNSVISIIESEDIRAQTLKKIGKDVNERNLRKYAKRIKTRKIGPQVVEVITKEKSEDKALELWNAVVDNSTQNLTRLGNTTDPFVGMVKISETPVLKTGYRDIYTFTATGLSLGFVLALLYLTISTYFSNYIPKKKR